MFFQDAKDPSGRTYRLLELPDVALDVLNPVDRQIIAVLAQLEGLFGFAWSLEQQPYWYSTTIDLGTAAGAATNAVTLTTSTGEGSIDIDRDSDFMWTHTFASSRLYSTLATANENGAIITNPGAGPNPSAAWAAGEGAVGGGSFADNPWTCKIQLSWSDRNIQNVAFDAASLGSASSGPRKLPKPVLVPEASKVLVTAASLIDLPHLLGGYSDFSQTGYVVRIRFALIGFKIYDRDKARLAGV